VPRTHTRLCGLTAAHDGTSGSRHPPTISRMLTGMGRKRRSMIAVLRARVRPYPWYRRVTAARGSQDRHDIKRRRTGRFQTGYRKRDGIRDPVSAQVGFHHRARELTRMVRQQHHVEDNAGLWCTKLRQRRRVLLHTECQFASSRRGLHLGNRRGIRNDRPIIPAYDVHDQGSCDNVPKGGEMLQRFARSPARRSGAACSLA